MEKSLAGTGKLYVSLQGRLRDEDLHIQGAGPEVNRDYGVVIDIPKSVLPDGLVAWLGELDTPLGSLAKTQRIYFVMQVRPKGDNLHFQVPKTGCTLLNRSYGATFDIPLWTRPVLEAFYNQSNMKDC